MTDIITLLKSYQPPLFAIDKVVLHFDLYEENATVKSELKIRRLQKGPLLLNGEELELIEILMNNQVLSSENYALTDKSLTIENCPDSFDLTITTRIFPQKNTALSGLYRTNHLFCTQCEAEGFRRITFFPDRPDVLTTFTTHISADKKTYPILLSNGNLIAEGDLKDGKHWATWHDPFKKPSYLFALVAGNLVSVKDTFITQSKREIDLRIYVEPGNENACMHAMNSLKRAMRWDEEMFGREYDLDIFMIVAVADFNMGAMENKGLNIFNAKYILATKETATDTDYSSIESVVAHEYFHNWTGNRITCRDWFQLSLKEGLTIFRDQEFSRDMNSRDVYRIMDVNILRSDQFIEDAGKMAHPVRPESYEEINNFYTATIYNKGAELIRMQQTLLGPDGFRKGMDLYFERHDGQAVTIDDYVAAMEDANKVDLTQFKLWYSQAGTPRVKVESTEFKDGKLHITLSQSCPKTPESSHKKPFHIPISIALFNELGAMIPIHTSILELREQKQTFTFEGLTTKPLISLLRDFSAPIILEYKQSEAELLALLRFETNGFAKWDALQRLMMNYLHQWIEAPLNQMTLSKPFLDALNAVLLDDTLDHALRAELLSTPDFEEVILHLSEVDVALVERIRDAFDAQLGAYLFDSAKRMYEAFWSQEDGSMDGKAFGRRALRNTCLGLMMNGHEEKAIATCHRQFLEAQTMTDTIESLDLLVDSKDEVLKQKALTAFYERFKNKPLALDKWFTIQACSILPNTLEQVKRLLKHDAFSLKNPNKVRALLYNFCNNNPRNFHAIDGSGYEFLKDMLLKIDRINPQVAASLAWAFTQWQQYDKPRQELMIDALKTLNSHKLSSDLKEVVSKSLKG